MNVNIHHHTQSSHSYHTFPPQDVHYQGQQATSPSVQQVVPKVPNSYGLQLATASDSFHCGGELEYPHILMAVGPTTITLYTYKLNVHPFVSYQPMTKLCGIGISVENYRHLPTKSSSEAFIGVISCALAHCTCTRYVP